MGGSYPPGCEGTPYDDEPDWAADYGINCPECGSEYIDDLKSKKRIYGPIGFQCDDCGHEWEQELKPEDYGD
jgi:uncharacterized Zn finger protein